MSNGTVLLKGDFLFLFLSFVLYLCGWCATIDCDNVEKMKVAASTKASLTFYVTYGAHARWNHQRNCLIINESLGYIFHILDDDFTNILWQCCWSWHLCLAFYFRHKCFLFILFARVHCYFIFFSIVIISGLGASLRKLHCIGWWCLWAASVSPNSSDFGMATQKKTNDSTMEWRFFFIRLYVCVTTVAKTDGTEGQWRSNLR